MKEKKSFVFYYDWQEPLSYLSNSEIGELVMGLLNYAKDGTLPEFKTRAIYPVFSIFKTAVDRDCESYEKKCNKNADNIKKRWNKKDNKTIPNDTTVYDRINSDTKNTDNDNDNDNDNDIYIKSTSSSPAVTVGKGQVAYSDDFLDFWSEYPKKVGKGAAFKVWQKQKIKQRDLSDIKTALNWQTKSEQWKRNNGRYIPNPSTYLSQRRWEDEPYKTEQDITDPARYFDDDEDRELNKIFYG